MAPITAEAARPVQKQQARRPLSRIVPAIPHRLSRPVPAARPITPEESHRGAVTQQKQEPTPQTQQLVVEEKKVELQPAEAVQTPLTPESKTFVEKPEAEVEAEAPALASSPVKLQDEEVKQVAEPSVPLTNDESNHVHDAPPATEVDSKPLTNGVHRKELPPPFYPSNMSGMHTPVVENHDNVFYPARPSVDGAMGGIVQDSLAQPATPHGYKAAGHGHGQSVPRIPPGFAPPDFTPSFFPGHSHHPSDAGAPWLYPPYSMPPPPEPMYGNGSEFQSPPFSARPSAFPDPYQGHFSPEDPRFATNGIATSHSQSPSKSQFGEPLPIADRAEVQHAQPQQNGAGPRSDEMSESPFELASYLSTQFGNPEFADFVLQVRSPEFQYMSIPVHGIVVVRSPVIAKAVRRSIPPAHRSRDSRRLVDVLTTNPFVATESIQEAIKVLYGAPLLSVQAFLYGLGHYTPEVPHAQVTKDARRRMDQLLSYIAAGSVLQIPSMQARGVEIAKALLRWDTVEQVLHYGLHAARSTSPSNTEGAEVHDPFATELLNAAIDFVAYNFPSDFNLYRIASELQDDPRLLSVTEARAPAHNPRLSKIRFGDAPTDDDTQASPVSRTLSSILLSLPLPLLDRLFNHRATANQIGWTGAAKVLHDVVDERESRRQKAVRGQLQLDSAASSALLDNLYIEERVDHVGASPLHPSGYMISAHRANGQA
ncbi:hypothetical protein BU25DRAFT_405446 [Macroventuria anomochaeta]|uniref:Uncharacterized protein n=1 Tax=Macroventuria anomochaeta TaxID=301207 RepID=A0ACB6SJ29_9PLEO|nr:uncharacterized protein BU25DRAFT_405446 [Macroventuria anomochaeta]KAF2633582.1 hypothetical protein BU25DRAFT_405446 [Macroventuria anomochaeta]